MEFRVVAISLLAAICLGSPATIGSASAEQMIRGRGAHDRGAGPRERAPVGGHVPGGIVRQRPPVTINTINIGPSRGPRFYAPSYYDRWARGVYRWSPIGYVPWSLIYGAAGWSNFGFYASLGPSAYYAPYGYGGYAPGMYPGWQVAGVDIGRVRLKIRPRDAQVFVDGAYAGVVDDFDGVFQSLQLEAGSHKIEVRMPGFEDFEIDVHVQPGRTLTLEEVLRPRP